MTKIPKCPKKFTIGFAKKLIKYVGGNYRIIRRNWCWPDFVKNYYHLRKDIGQYFEQVETGDPSYAAYSIYEHAQCKASLRWAKNIIQKAKSGNPSQYAYWIMDSSDVSKQWTKMIIENAKTGDPSLFAYMMVYYHGLNIEWGENIIENANTGDPLTAAKLMVRLCNSKQEWYQNLKKNKPK